MNFVKKFQKFQGGSLRGVDHKLKINNVSCTFKKIIFEQKADEIQKKNLLKCKDTTKKQYFPSFFRRTEPKLLRPKEKVTCTKLCLIVDRK